MNKLTSDHQFLENSGNNAGNYVKNNSGAADIVINKIFETNT